MIPNTREALLKYPGKYWYVRTADRPTFPAVQGNPYSASDSPSSTEEILAFLDEGFFVTIMQGPFETREDAHYALDLAWEVPE